MNHISEILEKISSLEENERNVLLAEIQKLYVYKSDCPADTGILGIIQQTICSYYGIKNKDIMAETRKKEIVFTRQLIMYFARRYTHYSLSEIGLLCGERDHATVIHSCRKIDKLIEKNIQVKELVRMLNDQLKLTIANNSDI